MEVFRRVGIVVGALTAVLAVGLLAYQLGVSRGRGEGLKEAGKDAGGQDRSSPSPGPASVVPPSPTGACAEGTTLAMAECAQEEYQREAATLDAALSQVRTREPASRQAALDESQRQWEIYVATFCSAHGMDGGSIAGVNVATCKAAFAHQRAVDVCNWFMPNAELGALADPPEACRPLRR